MVILLIFKDRLFVGFRYYGVSLKMKSIKIIIFDVITQVLYPSENKINHKLWLFERAGRNSLKHERSGAIKNEHYSELSKNI